MPQHYKGSTSKSGDSLTRPGKPLRRFGGPRDGSGRAGGPRQAEGSGEGGGGGAPGERGGGGAPGTGRNNQVMILMPKLTNILTSDNVKKKALEGASFPQGVRSGVMNCELALNQAQTGFVVDAQRTVRASADRCPHRGGAGSQAPSG